MKIFRFAVILVLTLCSGLRLHAQLPKDEDGIKVVINDTIITSGQVLDYIDPAVQSLRNEYAGKSQAAFEQKANSVYIDGLEQLVERQLILHDFDSQGYRMPDSYLDELVQDRIRDQFYGDRVTLMKTLQAQGVTLEQYRQKVHDQAVETFMRSKNVAQEIVVSPYKIENYFNAHQDDFEVADEVKLRMIVLNKTSADDTNAVNLAREIRAKIVAGASFAEMAGIYSQGSQQKQGGDWGWTERYNSDGTPKLLKELDAVAFTLPPGQVSDAIDSSNAVFLVLVEDKHAAHVKPLKEVRDEIERSLRAQEQSRLEKQWIAKLKAKTFILRFP